MLRLLFSKTVYRQNVVTRSSSFSICHCSSGPISGRGGEGVASGSGGEAVVAHLKTTDAASKKFNVKMLEYLVCPLSKAQLRFDSIRNELICDELQVAYPIKNGVPNLLPQAGRKLDNTTESKS